MLTLSVFALLQANTLRAEQTTSWCATQTLGFEVVSDLPPDELSALLSDLIRFKDFAEPWLPGTATAADAPMKMLVFATHQGFKDYFGTARVVGFMQPSLTTSTLVMAPHWGDRRLLETARHEYAHYLLRNRLDASLPVWYDEGLASLLSNITVAGDTATMGELPMQRMQSLFARDARRPLSIKQVLEADNFNGWSADKVSRFYAYAWLLTHYLLLGADDRVEPLQAYLSERARPLGKYLGYSNASLERRLKRYSERRPAEAKTAYPAAPDLELTSRCLSPEARDRAIAGALIDHSPDNARSLLEPQLESSPEDPELLVLLSRASAAIGDDDAARDYADQALAAAPDNPAVLTNAGNRMTGQCLLRRTDDCRDIWRDALPYYQRALELDLTRFDAVFGVGLAYLHSGRAGEAVNYLKVVYSRAPWAVPVNFYLGESYRIIGDRRAGLYLRNALNWSSNPLWQELARMALDELAG